MSKSQRDAIGLQGYMCYGGGHYTTNFDNAVIEVHDSNGVVGTLSGAKLRNQARDVFGIPYPDGSLQGRLF